MAHVLGIMNTPVITGLTVSVDVSDKNYGTGPASFMNLQGRYPDPATLDQVLVDGLDMYFAAFKSLLASRYATGVIAGPEFKKTLEAAEIKLAKVRTFLLKEQEPEVAVGE